MAYRRRLLLGFAWVGSLATALHLVLPVDTHASVYFAAVFSIVAVACFGDSFVCLNAYLGQLVRDDPQVAESAGAIAKSGHDNNRLDASGRPSDDQEDVALLAAAAEALDPDLPSVGSIPDEHSRLNEDDHIALVSLVTTRTSSMGIAIGYAAGVSILCLSAIPVTRSQGSLQSLSLVIGLTGLWWAMFTIPASIWLPSERSAEAPTVDVKNKILEGWRRVAQVFDRRELRRLSRCYWFLLSWALLADGECALRLRYIGV